MTDPTVVGLIQKHFVPVGIDWKTGGSGKKTVADKQLQKEWDLARRAPTGLFVLDHGGKMIAVSKESTPEAVVSFLRDAVNQFGSREPRNATAAALNSERGVGMRPDGTVQLAVAARAMPPKAPDPGLNKKSPPMLDSAYLTQAEVRALAPARAEVGHRYSLPAYVCQQFAPALTSGGDAFYRMRPQDVTVARLEAEVINVTVNRVEVRVSGILNGERSFGGGQGQMETDSEVSGLFVFDGEDNLKSLLLICCGRYVNTHSHSNTAIAGLVEWQSAPAKHGERRDQKEH